MMPSLEFPILHLDINVKAPFSHGCLLGLKYHSLKTIAGGIRLIRPLRTKISEILIEILTFSFPKMSLKVSSAKWRPFRLGLNVLKTTFSRLIV